MDCNIFRSVNALDIVCVVRSVSAVGTYDVFDNILFVAAGSC